MKLFTFPILCILVGLACLVAADDAAVCRKKNGSLANMIPDFCQLTNLVVPSWYAKKGLRAKDKHTKIWITGDCKPAQWVPKKYCVNQFYRMCATGGAHGGKVARFGGAKCQKWTIQYLRHPKVY